MQTGNADEVADTGAAKQLPILTGDSALITHHERDDDGRIPCVGQCGEDVAPHRSAPTLDADPQACLGLAQRDVLCALAGAHVAGGADVIGEHGVFAIETAGVG